MILQYKKYILILIILSIVLSIVGCSNESAKVLKDIYEQDLQEIEIPKELDSPEEDEETDVSYTSLETLAPSEEKTKDSYSNTSATDSYTDTLVTPSPYIVPFTAESKSSGDFVNPPMLYEYLEGDNLYYNHVPNSQSIELGEECISIAITWGEPHGAVTHWIRDIEVKDNVMIINTLRLDEVAGPYIGIGILCEINATVDRIYAPGVNEYKVVTRNVKRAPDRLTVTIRESEMDRVINKDFVPADFGPLVSEIQYSHWDLGFLPRRLVVHVRPDMVQAQIEALPFVTQVQWGIGLGVGVGRQMVLYIDPAYNDKFDREQFTLSDFSEMTDVVAILEYKHPHIRVDTAITLILHTPGTENLNRLKDYVNNNVPAVETID